MFKKSLAMLLCVVLMLSLATVAFADEATRITVQAENATEKHLNTEVITDYKNDPILWNGKDTHENRPIDAETGYHYSEGWGQSVINICPRDWYVYTFEVATAGTYNFGVKGGTDRNTPFVINVDGSETPETNEPMPAPGNYPFAEVTIHTLHLDAGTHTIKISINENKNHNLAADYFYLDLVEADAAPVQTVEILKGTAEIDGVLDEAYKSSFSTTVSKENSPAIWVPKADPDNVSATVYFMHDGEFLYVCGVVTGDSTIVDSAAKGWACDGIDLWFLLPTLPERTKVTLDAFAQPYGDVLQFGYQEDKHNLDVTKIQKAAVRGEGTYVVEAKLPIPYYMESEGSLAINVQLNNVYDANVNENVAGSNCGFYGKQFTNPGNELDAIMAVLSDTAATVPQPPVTDPQPPVTDPEPPITNTGDVIAVIVAMLAISGLGIAVVAGKKK